MAFDSGRIPKETQDYLASKANPKSGKAGAVFLIGLVICVGVIISMASDDMKRGVGPTEPLKPTPPVHPYQPNELIAEATKDMSNGNFRSALEEISELQEVDRKRPVVLCMFNRATREARLSDAKAARVARLEYAKDYERGLLESGQDYTVRAEGAKADNLSVRFVLVNRPYVYNIQNNEELNARWSALGFKSVRVTDGFDSSWSYSLK